GGAGLPRPWRPRGLLGMQQGAGLPWARRGVYQSVVHSQTLPVMSKRPYVFGGNASTGDVPSKPSTRRFCQGNSPCQKFAIGRPSGINSLPHAYSAPSSPPRAANSHSAAVGSDFPLHRAYASPSAYATWTTGKLLRPRMVELGPIGWRQSAPRTYFHQLRKSRMSTGPPGFLKTSEPGDINSFFAPGYCEGSGAISATVRWPVAFTNSSNWALVTGT